MLGCGKGIGLGRALRTWLWVAAAVAGKLCCWPALYHLACERGLAACGLGIGTEE